MICRCVRAEGFAGFFLIFLVFVAEFWETQSLARLSDYDTTRGYVNGNIFHWEITTGSQPLIMCTPCFTFSVACHFIASFSTAASPRYARERLMTRAGHSSKHKARSVQSTNVTLERLRLFGCESCQLHRLYTSWARRRRFVIVGCVVLPYATLQSLLPPFAHRSSTFLKTRFQDGFQESVACLRYSDVLLLLHSQTITNRRLREVYQNPPSLTSRATSCRPPLSSWSAT